MFYKSMFYKSMFYKSTFYKSMFYKSTIYKSMFYKSSPVQSSPVLQYSFLCWTSAGEISSKLQRSRCLASGSPIFCPAAFIARFSLYYLYAARKTSGTERCFSPSPLTFEFFDRITFTPIRLEVSNCDYADRHVKKCQKWVFNYKSLQKCQFFMAFAGVKTTPVKKVLNPKSALSCRLCGASVANGGYYSLTSDIAENLGICLRISSLFGVRFTRTGWQDSKNVLALNKIKYPTCLLIA